MTDRRRRAVAAHHARRRLGYSSRANQRAVLTWLFNVVKSTWPAGTPQAKWWGK